MPSRKRRGSVMLRTVLSASLLALPLTVLTSPAAFAGDHRAGGYLPPNQVAVSVRDVDFDRPEAVAALYQRLQYASRVACDTLEPEEPFREPDDRACER